MPRFCFGLKILEWQLGQLCGPEPLVEDFKSLQSVFTNMIQGVILDDDTVDNLVTIAGEELDEAL